MRTENFVFETAPCEGIGRSHKGLELETFDPKVIESAVQQVVDLWSKALMEEVRPNLRSLEESYGKTFALDVLERYRDTLSREFKFILDLNDRRWKVEALIFEEKDGASEG